MNVQTLFRFVCSVDSYYKWVTMGDEELGEVLKKMAFRMVPAQGTEAIGLALCGSGREQGMNVEYITPMVLKKEDVAEADTSLSDEELTRLANLVADKEKWEEEDEDFVLSKLPHITGYKATASWEQILGCEVVLAGDTAAKRTAEAVCLAGAILTELAIWDARVMDFTGIEGKAGPLPANLTEQPAEQVRGLDPSTVVDRHTDVEGLLLGAWAAEQDERWGKLMERASSDLAGCEMRNCDMNLIVNYKNAARLCKCLQKGEA